MSILLQQILFGSVIIFFAFFTRSLFGFGGALISIPLLAFFFPLQFAVPLESIFEVLLSVLLIKGELHKINKQALLPLIIGALIGTLIGTFLLKSFANDLLQRLLGVMIILFSLNLLRKQYKVEKLFPAPLGIVTGVVSGILGGMFGTSGPPFVLYLAHQIKSKDVLRATLIGLFAIDFTWRLGIFAITGLLSKRVLLMALYLTPALVLGTVLGKWSYVTIDEKLYRRLIVGLLLITGALLIIK